MKLISILLFAFCTMAAQPLSAQDVAGSCNLDDSECLEAQSSRQCGDPSVATVQSCGIWIQSIQTRARAEDRVALRHIAEAHVTISQILTRNPDERLNHRNSAREIYAELVEQDASDVRAILGMATLARDVNERIELLRRIVAITPSVYEAEQLADALTKRGGEKDMSDAAQILERAYQQLPKGVGRDIGARAVALYELAGTPERGRNIKDRVREELNAVSLVSELNGVPVTTSARAGDILGELCDKSVVDLLGASPCLEGMRAASMTLKRLSGRTDAQGFGEVLAKQAWSHTYLGREQLARDANWRATVSNMFLEMEAANIESPVILISRAGLVERDPVQKRRLLDRAAQLTAPEDGPALWQLANEYILLRSRPEAVALLRRVRELPTTTESERRLIDSNIASLENAEQVFRESEALR